MKKTLVVLILLIAGAHNSWAQNKSVRPPAIGVSFFFNDFITPERIRSGSMSEVIRKNQWAKFREMSPGVALTYFKGLHPCLDFAGTMAISFPSVKISDEASASSEAMLLEADASVNLKMFSEDYWFTPYFIAGVGASKYQNYYGAFIPLGGGVKVNFFDEAALFITSQYRVPVTTETNNYHFFTNIGISGVIGGKKETEAKPTL